MFLVEQCRGHEHVHVTSTCLFQCSAGNKSRLPAKWKKRLFFPGQPQREPPAAGRKRPAAALASTSAATSASACAARKDAKAKAKANPRKTPSDLLTIDPLRWQSRAPRGFANARLSTVKAVRSEDAKHPHQCAVCCLWVGGRCKVHCGAFVRASHSQAVSS